MTRNTARAGAAGALLLALGAALGAADAPRVVFGVGVLRRDGIIIPFGAFDGKRWSNNWPAPQDDLTVPINVRDVPSRWWGPTRALQTWQAWTLDVANWRKIEADIFNSLAAWNLMITN